MLGIDKEMLTKVLESIDIDEVATLMSKAGGLAMEMREMDDDDPLNQAIIRIFSHIQISGKLKAQAKEAKVPYEVVASVFLGSFIVGLLTPVPDPVED